VKNTTSDDFNYFAFNININDKDGVTVETTTASTDNWEAGTKHRFEFETEKSFKSKVTSCTRSTIQRKNVIKSPERLTVRIKLRTILLFQKHYAGMLRKNDITPSNNDIAKHMDELIINIKKSEAYPEYEQASEDLGTTYEKILRNNIKAYRISQTIENVYEAFIKPYETNDQVTTSEQEEIDNKIQKAWKAYENNIVAQYKKLGIYTILR